jgi:hypothetical protein
MTLRQSSVDAAVVALWLGHESITNADQHANLAMKEKAFEKILPRDTPFRRFHADHDGEDGPADREGTAVAYGSSLRQRLASNKCRGPARRTEGKPN